MSLSRSLAQKRKAREPTVSPRLKRRGFLPRKEVIHRQIPLAIPCSCNSSRFREAWTMSSTFTTLAIKVLAYSLYGVPCGRRKTDDRRRTFCPPTGCSLSTELGSLGITIFFSELRLHRYSEIFLVSLPTRSHSGYDLGLITDPAVSRTLDSIARICEVFF